MKVNNTLTDAAVLEELGKRLAHARIASSLTQADLADQAAVGKRTVERIEAGESVQLISLIRVLRVLDLLEAFDEIAPEGGPGPIEILERHGKVRQRASSARTKSLTKKPWAWGDER